MSDSSYYQITGKVGLASSVSLQVRQRIFERFIDVMQPTAETTVLDLGVTNDLGNKESNFFEEMYPYKSQITCVGTEDASGLEAMYAGTRFMQVVAHQPLPFEDNAFDVLFSNAVIEHTGSQETQRFFVAEALRVAKRVFMTTPNRWFPIELHTVIPVMHYLPKPAYQQFLRTAKLDYWADEENLNLLTLREFRARFPADYPLRIERIGIGWGSWRSNLIAYTT